MITLRLNCYTEREKLLLLQALTEAEKYLADRGVHADNAPHLVHDITHAAQFVSSEHVHDVVARTLGIKPVRKPASLDDLMHPDEWAFFLQRFTEQDAALARELANASPDELSGQWGKS